MLCSCVVLGLALAAPHRDIYSGLCGYNSALCCIAIGGVFYVLTCQTHILCILCGVFLTNNLYSCYTNSGLILNENVPLQHFSVDTSHVLSLDCCLW